MKQRRNLTGYIVALLALALATLIRWLLDPVLEEQTPFVTYFAAVAFVGLYGGLGPAVLTLVFGGVMANLSFIEPHGVLPAGARDWAAFMLYAMGAGLVVVVTERLRRSRASLAAIVSTAHEGIITKSLDGIVTGWNAGAERIYGYTRDEMIGTPVQRLSPPNRTGESAWLGGEIEAGRSVERFETQRIRKDGQRIDVLLSAAPVYDSRGRVTGIAAIERDVTEQKRVERARRTSEARLQAIMDNSPVVLFIKDLEGRYFMVNRSYVELFGTTAEQILGTTDLDRFPPEKAAMYQHNDAEVLASGEARKFEETVEVDGEARTYLSTKFPLRDDRGEIYAVCGIATDVTEETRRHEQLVDLDRRKDQFLSMLAHELRNPLAPLANAAQLIKLEGDKLSPRGSWAGEVVERQVKHLARMVDDLLDIARFNTGRVQLRRERVDMTVLAGQVAEDLQGKFERAGVALEVSVPDDPVIVDADPARIVQVVDNLLDNAAKYTDNGGNARLEVTVVDGACEIRVSDTGIGIERGHIDHVFDLFEQVDDSLDRSSGGLGLGLNLVKRMVELHGGRVSARSEGRGRGSEFVVQLPLSSRTETAEPAAPTAADALSLERGRRVLIIEDNADAARSMAMLLQSLGHEVRVAGTGREGLELADANPPQLVLVDLGLPDIDGCEIARSLRSRFGPGLTLVAVTGYGQEEYRRRTREAGFDDHLLKPLAREALDRVLATSAA